MPKIKMTSIKGHRYAGRWQAPGTEYEAQGQQHADLMVALKNATVTPGVPAMSVPEERRNVGTYKTRHQVAEEPAADVPPRPAVKRAAAKKSLFRRSQAAEE